jgi:hypothetical protein
MMVATVCVLTVLAVWLGLLTVLVLRRRRDDGQPVYRRMRDGRIRFEWSVAQQLRAAQREALRETQPLPRMPHPRS